MRSITLINTLPAVYVVIFVAVVAFTAYCPESSSVNRRSRGLDQLREGKERFAPRAPAAASTTMLRRINPGRPGGHILIMLDQRTMFIVHLMPFIYVSVH